jgi:hypothetical protein
VKMPTYERLWWDSVDTSEKVARRRANRVLG